MIAQAHKWRLGPNAVHQQRRSGGDCAASGIGTKSEKLRLAISTSIGLRFGSCPKEEGGCYLVDYPDIRGCMSHGETIEQAIANGRETLRDVVDVFNRPGWKIGEQG
jgi:hypothetical protein